jgi:hypothetical protein
MRPLLPLLLLFTVGWAVVLAQDADEAASNIACVERIQLPLHDYYQLVQQSRIQGTITASVFLTQNISARLIVVELSSPKLWKLVAAIEEALKKAKIRSDCEDKKTIMVFRFEIKPLRNDQYQLGATLADKSGRIVSASSTGALNLPKEKVNETEGNQ